VFDRNGYLFDKKRPANIPIFEGHFSKKSSHNKGRNSLSDGH